MTVLFISCYDKLEAKGCFSKVSSLEKIIGEITVSKLSTPPNSMFLITGGNVNG